MSDSKRTGGGRDISDLKARLGLKKGGAAPATGQSARSTNGVVAPPGLNLPPPPGMQQPAGPVIPNAADDPFGAMNAMAAVATVQRAPEIVIVTHDGKPVENVGQASMGATIAKIAVPAVITLIIGVAIGKIGQSASAYNAGIEDAKQLLGDKGASQSIIGLKQTLSKIDTLLDEARTRNQFRPDKKFDTDLKALAAKLEVKEKSVLTRARALGDDTAGSVHAFYAGVSEIKAMIDTHVKAATADNNAFTKGKERMDAATIKDTENAPLQGQLRFAILLQAPTDSEKHLEFGAKLVEIGGVYCGTDTKPVVKCGENEAPTGVAYRSEVGASIMTKGDIQSPTTDAIPSKKIVQLVGSANSIRDTLIKGADGVASEVYYTRRLRTLYETLRGKPGAGGKPSGGLIDMGNDLERKMATEAHKDTKFSWFM